MAENEKRIAFLNLRLSNAYKAIKGAESEPKNSLYLQAQGLKLKSQLEQQSASFQCHQKSLHWESQDYPFHLPEIVLELDQVYVSRL